MLAIVSGGSSRAAAAADEMGFPNTNRHHQQHHPARNSSSSSSSSSSRVPRLERRNAAKNIDYDVSWASSSSEDFAVAVRATRSLDVSPTAYSNNQKSFRIEGVDGEVDLLCRSLGLSGPDEFSIPADAWEARKARSISRDPAAAAVVSLSVRVSREDLAAGILKVGDSEMADSRSEGGMNCVRPPPARSGLTPPRPALPIPVLEKSESSWDLLRSFAPEDVEDDFAGDGGATPSDSSEEEAADSKGMAAEGEEVRMGETVEDLNQSSSAAAAADMEAMFVVSTHGRFKRHIMSWMRGGLLGSGSFGTVYEGISDDGFFFAVKEVSLLDQGSEAKQCILQLEQEIALLSQFEHENIVQYFGTDKEEAKLYIFLELVTQGSLASLYQRYHLRDSQVSAYTRQILNGLNYLHERNVVHRDIKCANILVDANGSVKLADFGLAKEINKWNMLKSCKGSVYWMAPEVVNPKRTYGPAADIWSLGCAVLEMLTRQVPYPNLEWAQAFFRIGRGIPPPIPPSLSKDARDFIERCVRVDPDDRPSALLLLEHPFVKRPPTPPSPSSIHCPCSR